MKRSAAKKTAGKRGARKSVARKSPGKTPVLISQAHGGALRQGNPGNAGGTGRPPSEVRRRARGSFYDRIPILEAIADGKKSKNPDKIRAITTLGRIGLMGNVNMDDVRERLERTLTIIRGELDSELAERVIAKIRAAWVQ